MIGVALLDVAHVLSFPGMPDFILPNTPAKASQFSLASRLAGGLAMVLIVLPPVAQSVTHAKRLMVALLVGCYVAASVALTFSTPIF